MDNFKDLEVIYLALEEGEVLRDIRNDWGPADVAEFGIEFNQLLELRDFVLDQDYSKNLGFHVLMDAIFTNECRKLLQNEETEIWSSIESNLDFTIFSISMGALIKRDFMSIKESILNDFILQEVDGLAASKELKKQVRDNFKKWQSSDEPEVLIAKLPEMASKELEKLKELRG